MVPSHTRAYPGYMARKKRGKRPRRQSASLISAAAREHRILRTGLEHWNPGDWRGNLDAAMADPRHPQAFPAEHAADLVGQIRVRLCAEDGHLVAYGFGGQRVAIPSSKMRAVRWLEEYRTPV